MNLRIRVLGPFEVEGVAVDRLGSRKARTLLKVLALGRGRPVPVDAIVMACWGDEPPAHPSDQVAVLVSRLRAVLGRERVVRGDAGYALDISWLDLDAAEELVHEAEQRLAAGSPVAARTAAAAALALVRGPLLVDEPDASWAELDRAAADRLGTRLRQVAAEASLAVGALADAVDLCDALLEHDPYDEQALRLLMAALTAAGRPASALAAYARARARLAEDLGVDPSVATEAVHTAILRDEPLAGLGVVSGGGPMVAVTPAPAPSELPGRGDAMAALDAALARAGAHGTEIVEVAGEAGIGKTALLDAWERRVAARGVVVLRGTCDQLERSLPLQAVLDALDARLRIAGPDALGPLPGAHRASLARLLPSLVPSEPERWQSPMVMEAAAGPDQLFGSLLAALSALSAGAPTALLLDDVHLAGPATVDWLGYVAAHRRDHPLLVVAARRVEEGQPLPTTERLELMPLDLAATATVVGADRAPALHARSGGHPLFLVELAASEGLDEDLPTSIREAVAGRCDRAGAAAPTLRTAALLGGHIDLDLLTAVTRLPPAELLSHLEEGVARRILAEEGTGFVFPHELVRSALVAGTPAARVAFVHREAARALASRSDADPLEVAYHARQGGDVEEAAAAFVRAAALAADRYDHDTAEQLLDRSVALADHPDRRLARARVRAVRGRYPEAIADAHSALDQGAGAAALEIAGWASYWDRDFGTARDLADDGARLATDDATRAACLLLAGRTRHAQGDLPGAEARLVGSTELAAGSQLAVASVWLGTLRSHQSRVVEAVDLLRAASRAGGSAGDLGARLHALLFLGHAYALAGQPAAALAALEQYRTQVEETQAARFAGRAENFSAWVVRNLGAAEQAAEWNQAALGTRPDAIVETEVAAHLDLAEGALMADDLAGADGHLVRAAETLGRPESLVFGWRLRMKLDLLRARLALADRRADEALWLAGSLAERARAAGVPRYAVPAQALVLRAQQRTGHAPDPASAATVVGALGDACAIDAWRQVGECAADLGIDAWWRLADELVVGVARHAGDRAEAFRRHARGQLDALRAGVGP